jgi:FkbM family methyltransferase
MVADALYRHIVGYFCARRGARRIEWQDLDRDMLALTAALSPDERRRLTQLLRRLYRQAFNENYNPRTNGEFWLIGRLAPILRCALDVGANVGTWTVEALARAPDAEIHAFERLPEAFAELKQRLLGREGARLNNVGLLDRNTRLALNVVRDRLDLSTMYSLDMPTQEVMCEFVRGDVYVANAGIAAIDIMKIDCEGAEPKVLDGLTDTLNRGAVALVQLEYGPFNVQSRWLLRDLHARLGGLGYRVGRLYPNYVDFKNYEIDDETFFGGNFVACLKSRGDLIVLIAA